AGPGLQYNSYLINHATKTLSSSGTLFWTLCGDHGDVISPSDGKDYLITHNCYNEAAIYRVDITITQSASNLPKQQSDNVRLVAYDWPEVDGHFSCASKGVNQDWCYASVESSDDTFSSMGTWRPYKQEILMVQMVA